MIEFKPLELRDKEWIDPIVCAENSKSADFSFGTMFIWDKSFKQEVARYGDRLVVGLMYACEPFFVYPIGSGELAPVIEELRLRSESQDSPLTLRGVTAEHTDELERLFPGKFEFTADRPYFDYIYSAEKLATLTGKKLHAKRNHINKFTAENDWSFEPFTADLVPECAAMLERWERSGGERMDEGLKDEHTAIIRAFDYFDELNFTGGVLRISSEIAAFTLGERINGDTFNIHFEKAYADIQGAYPMINREFARHILEKFPGEIAYINREDDIGLENLRKAKMSYCPEFLVEKHTAVWR